MIMFVSVEKVQIGVTNFIEQEIASKAVGFQKFATYFVLPKVNKTIEYYMQSLKDNPIMKDSFNENGALNVDELYNLAKQAVRKSGQFSIYGVLLDETDIDKLYEYIAR
jgi:hypothetical protein